jgi:excisionase family DNA binding protein
MVSGAGSKRSQRIPHLDEDGSSATLSDRLLTVTDLCRLLGMSRRWVHERTRRREIPCYRFGTALRFDLEDVRRWMADFYATKPSAGGGETWES